MPVGVVKPFEVIDITHRQHIIAPQALHPLVKCAAARQAGEFITKGHLIGLMRHTGRDHQHDLAAHDVQGERQDEGLRQHPEQPQQTDQLRSVQRPRLVPVLRCQGDKTYQEHGVRQLDQAHPTAVQRRPTNLRQPVQQGLWETLLQRQRHTADGKQHRATGNEVAEQVGFLLPQRIDAEQQRQQQATQMKDHRRVFADTAIVAVVIGLGVQQEVNPIHRDHQEQLTLATIHRAVRTAEQQHKGRQHVEQ